jgi:phosphatidylserine/phosphatidylglycerophosphate/cardiolipin synthase-like enzyme
VDRDGLPLTARLADPGGRFEKVHAKSLVVEDTVLIGSLNWNAKADHANHDMIVALESEGAARYFRRVLEADWTAAAAGRGADRPVPAGLLMAVVLGALVALVAGSRLGVT